MVRVAESTSQKARRRKQGRVKTLASDGLVPLPPTRQHVGIKRLAKPGFGKGERVTEQQLRVLEVLTTEWSTPKDIAGRSGMERMSVRNVLRTLCRKDLAERDVDRGMYRRVGAGS